MTPQFDAFGELIKFAGAFSFVIGTAAWLRKGSPEEDKVVSESLDILLDGLSDANNVGKIERATGVNIRDQVTTDQAKDWDRERELRKFPGRN